MPRKKTIKDRILDCIGKQKPTPWGKSIGLGSGTVTKIFKHEEAPSVKHLLTISKALGKSIDWLLTGENLSTTETTVAENQSDYVPSVLSPEEQLYIDNLTKILKSDNEQNKEAVIGLINTLSK